MKCIIIKCKKKQLKNFTYHKDCLNTNTLKKKKLSLKQLQIYTIWFNSKYSICKVIMTEKIG